MIFWRKKPAFQAVLRVFISQFQMHTCQKIKILRLFHSIYSFFCAMKKRLLGVFFLVFVSSQLVKAQVQDRHVGWYGLVTSVNLNKKWFFSTDIALRSSDKWAHFQTVFFRPGIGYRINSKASVTIGYNLLHSRVVLSNIGGYTDEHQFWQQLVFRWPLKHVLLTQRTMLEERIVPKAVLSGNKVSTDSYSFAGRTRIMIRAMFPFKGNGSFTKGFYALAQEETFFNLWNKKATNNSVFDQSRNIVGLGRRFSTHLDMDLGYQYRRIVGAAAKFNDHIIQLGMNLRL